MLTRCSLGKFAGEYASAAAWLAACAGCMLALIWGASCFGSLGRDCCCLHLPLG